MTNEDSLNECTGGHGTGRAIFARDGTCATCGFRPYRDMHCPLFERCERCADPDEPCATAAQIRQAVAALTV